MREASSVYFGRRGERIVSKTETTIIDKDDAALVFHKGGAVTAVLPADTFDKPDEITPPHVLVVAALSSLIGKEDRRLADLITDEARAIAEMTE